VLRLLFVIVVVAVVGFYTGRTRRETRCHPASPPPFHSRDRTFPTAKLPRLTLTSADSREYKFFRRTRVPLVSICSFAVSPPLPRIRGETELPEAASAFSIFLFAIFVGTRACNRIVIRAAGSNDRLRSAIKKAGTKTQQSAVGFDGWRTFRDLFRDSREPRVPIGRRVTFRDPRSASPVSIDRLRRL
jgi:hypothetical protein